MPEFTVPPHDVHECGTQSDSFEIRTDEGLRQALREARRTGSWDTTAGQALLTEVRRRAVRNAAHVASATGIANGRDLVDDVLLAAWIVLRQHADKVAGAERPWAYLMSSAQKQVLDEVRAQQLLTNAASVRGRAREVLPRLVRPVGSTPTELATALRHEPAGRGSDPVVDPRIACQVGRHEQPPLLQPSVPSTSRRLRDREAWFIAFIELLVGFGADETVTVAAVDRLADLFAVTYVGWWEWAARRDPVLARLGLSPDQCGALVALLAGSRRYRHNGRRDSVLGSVRAASEDGIGVELSALQRRRLAVYVGNAHGLPELGLVRLPPLAGVGSGPTTAMAAG